MVRAIEPLEETELKPIPNFQQNMITELNPRIANLRRSTRCRWKGWSSSCRSPGDWDRDPQP